MSKLWSERENQQDATVRCLLSTLSQHVSGIIIPIFRRPRHVLLHVVCCAGTVTFTVLAPYNTAPHNCYQPHPAEPAQHTTCSNTRLGLLKMGIMMPETCWESVYNKHLTVASCWFPLSLHYRQVSFYTTDTFLKSHINWNHANWTQNSHLKQCISWGFGNWPHPIQGMTILLVDIRTRRAVFLNCRGMARYQALASIIPGHERFSWNLSF